MEMEAMSKSRCLYPALLEPSANSIFAQTRRIIISTMSRINGFIRSMSAGEMTRYKFTGFSAFMRS